MTEYTQPPTEPPVGSPPAAPSPKTGFAVTALVLGIVAIVGAWIPILNVVSILIGLVGVVLGAIAIVKALKGTAGGKVMAIVGTSLSALAIIGAIIVNAATVAAVDDALDELDESSSVTTTTTDDGATDAEDTSADDAGEDDTAAEAPAEPVTGSLDNPASAGDGTVWVVEDAGDTWEITLDSIQLVGSYDGEQQMAILYGTATPTVIADGATSTWISFPRFEWIADGAVVDEDFTLPEDAATDGYRSKAELEATAGTTMEFYEAIGLPDGVVPELLTMEAMWNFGGDEPVYISTGLK